MKTIRLICKNCSANLEIKDNTACCPYCGTRLMFYDENKYTYNYTFDDRDEAQIREAEAKERIRLQELRNEENEKIRKHKQDKWFFIMIIGLMCFSLVMSFVFSAFEGPSDDEVQMPCSASDLEDENYEKVVQRLRDMGFHNIEIIAIDDLVTGWLDDEGDVEQVSIAGDADFDEGDIFSKDAKITITYHTF